MFFFFKKSPLQCLGSAAASSWWSHLWGVWGGKNTNGWSRCISYWVIVPLKRGDSFVFQAVNYPFWGDQKKCKGTLPKFNSEFTPERLPKPKQERIVFQPPFLSIFQGRAAKLRWCTIFMFLFSPHRLEKNKKYSKMERGNLRWD